MCRSWNKSAWPRCSGRGRRCRRSWRFFRAGVRRAMLDGLLERFHRGDRLALARLVSLMARGEHTASILSQMKRASKPARVVAITGSGGVGKSTLVGKLIEQARAHQHKVAVLACDPESPVSGG